MVHLHLSLVAALALTACSKPDSPEQHLEALAASNQVCCGGYSITTTSIGCLDQAHSQPALDCMNGALASGTRASYSVGALDNNFFAKDTLMFTVDHEVQVFVSYPEGDGHHDAAYAIEQPSCSGAFHLVLVSHACDATDGYELVVDGCP